MFKIFTSIKNFISRVAGTFRLVGLRTATAIALFCVGIVNAMAQGAGGFQKATDEISTYQGPVQKLLYAIAAVVALVGAFNIYFKMQNGDQDVKKSIMMTIGGCVAFVAMAASLPLFFATT